jgi:uncharacterized DUF497 family protein
MNGNARFEWDDTKAAANLLKHGIRFELAASVFLDEAVVHLDVSRAIDAEARRKAIGIVEGRLFTVVYTLRGGVIRVISLRRANTKERRAYEAVYP